MDEFVRGATSVLEVTVDQDISESTNIEMWIDTFNDVYKHEKDALKYVRVSNGVTTVGYQLTQYESLSCREDYISVQLRWTSDTGIVGATKKKYMVINDAEWEDRITLEPSDDEDDATYLGIDRIPERDILTMMNEQDG